MSEATSGTHGMSIFAGHSVKSISAATEQFRAARDFLLSKRTDYDGAVRDFVWPQFDHFNWALDWFDAIAGGNDRSAIWIVEEDGRETRQSFAQMSERS